MKKNQPSMHQIAKLANVSGMTVSRVLNNSGPVAEPTRQQVLRIARELGYDHYPNALSRILRGERSNSIGVLMSFARPWLAGNIISRIDRRLFNTEYVNYIVDTYSDPVVILRALETLAERRVDGVIYLAYTPKEMNTEIEKLLQRIRHVVIITHQELQVPFDQVVCGWSPGARQMVEYFAACGCRRPVLLQESPIAACRQLFEQACGECGMSAPAVITLRPEIDTDEAFERYLEQEFGTDFPGDAVFCSHERFRAPRSYLQRRHPEIPLAAVMDEFLIDLQRPDFPVLRRREPESGALACEMLLRRIEAPDMPPRTEHLPMEFLPS
jgi:DNA-binding LacI/PurR family transcriptional regulator